MVRLADRHTFSICVRACPQPEKHHPVQDEGDAVLTVFLLPHSGTRNTGIEPRKNCYFRIRAHAHLPGGPPVSGRHDHPDRGRMGEWLDYSGVDAVSRHDIAAICHLGCILLNMAAISLLQDPFEVSKDHLCDQWRVWVRAPPTLVCSRRSAGSGLS